MYTPNTLKRCMMKRYHTYLVYPGSMQARGPGCSLSIEMSGHLVYVFNSDWYELARFDSLVVMEHPEIMDLAPVAGAEKDGGRATLTF